MRGMLTAVMTLALSLVPLSRAAAAPLPFNVLADVNSSSATPLLTGLVLAPGDHLAISVAANDCWSAGAADRTTNANGLVGHTTNDCRPSAPTDYGTWSQFGFSFPFASLVGVIDGGPYFSIGTSYSATVTTAGPLSLMFWDSNSNDNTGFVTALVDVTPAAVPEPATLMLTGLGLTALARRRLRRGR